jgi:hypothetical protein
MDCLLGKLRTVSIHRKGFELINSDSTMSDNDRKPNPRELQALMELDPEVEDNESAGNGNFYHEE